jgi:hypothetical protein
MANSTIQSISTISYSSSLADNNSWQGDILTGTAGESLSLGDFVYFKFSDKKWYKALANTYATARCNGCWLQTSAANATGNILIRGTVRMDTWTWTTNAVWLSTSTAGIGTSTTPSTSTNLIQYLGMALDYNTLFFTPSHDIGEVI